MGVRIRKTNNHELIKRLDTKLFGEEKKDEAHEASVWFIAQVGGRIAGFAGISAIKESGRTHGFLERAGVLKEFRGLGLQRLLIRAREREAKRLGLWALFTYTADWNYHSSNNLIRCGFQLYDPYHRYGIKNALYWKKEL